MQGSLPATVVIVEPQRQPSCFMNTDSAFVAGDRSRSLSAVSSASHHSKLADPARGLLWHMANPNALLPTFHATSAERLRIVLDRSYHVVDISTDRKSDRSWINVRWRLRVRRGGFALNDQRPHQSRLGDMDALCIDNDASCRLSIIRGKAKARSSSPPALFSAHFILFMASISVSA